MALSDRDCNYQANHSVSVGDVNGVGNDEYLTGPACFNSNGTPRWTTGWGHGDANHLADHIPDRPGLEFFQPHEDSQHGMSMVDANTGEIIWSYYSSADVGRAWAADVDPRFRGSEVKAIGWPLYNAMGQEIGADYNAYNQPLYFDGTVNRAMRNQSNIESYAHGRILTGWYYGAETNHYTKHDAGLIADIMGDILPTDIPITIFFMLAMTGQPLLTGLMHYDRFTVGKPWMFTTGEQATGQILHNGATGPEIHKSLS